MIPRITTRSIIPPGSVVGTVFDAGSRRAAAKLAPGKVDLLELRVDSFADDPRELKTLEALAGRLEFPLVITVRHPAEGGASRLSAAGRRALYERFLPYAAWVDVELRSVTTLAPVLEAVRSAGKGLILSHHDFHTTPTLAKLQMLARKAAQAGADVFKVATTANTPAALATLSTFLTSTRRPAALAVMGMGPYGKISRLTLGSTGSVLNYGFLHRVQVPGQWPAPLLKERLAELR